MHTPWALRSKDPLIASGDSGAPGSQGTQGQPGFTVTGNPLYQLTGEVTGGTSGSGGQSVSGDRGSSARQEYLPPLSLEGVFAESAASTPGQSLTPGVAGRMQHTSVSVSAGGLGLSSASVAPAPSAGGSSSIGGKVDVPEWSGGQGTVFYEFMRGLKVVLTELKGKGRDAQALLDRVAVNIVPMSFGSQAHKLVREAVIPLVLETLQGRVIPVDAVVVPELEHLRTGHLGMPVQQQAGEVLPDLLALTRAMHCLTVSGVASPDDVKQVAMEIVGSWQPLLVDVELLNGQVALEQFVRQRAVAAAPSTAVAAAGASSSAQQAPLANLHGWQHVAGDMYWVAEHGVVSIKHMPVIVYWATMVQYFGIMSPAQVAAVRALLIGNDDSLSDFTARLGALVEAVRSDTAEQHVERVQQVLRALSAAGLKAHPDKCIFMAEGVEYLGHVVSPAGLSPHAARVAAFKQLRLPTTKDELSSQLGMLGFYRCYLPGYSIVAEPLRKMRKQNSPSVLQWDEETRAAYQGLLEGLARSDVVVEREDPSRPFVLHTD